MMAKAPPARLAPAAPGFDGSATTRNRAKAEEAGNGASAGSPSAADAVVRERARAHAAAFEALAAVPQPLGPRACARILRNDDLLWTQEQPSHEAVMAELHAVIADPSA